MAVVAATAPPKQLLKLTGSGKTMLEEAVDRVAPIVSPEHVYIQTMKHLLAPNRAAVTGIPAENIIADPCKRNTSGCVAYAAAYMLGKYGGDGGDINMAIVTADHHIEPDAAFRETVEATLSVAERDPVLVTIGVSSARPATGYGYIQVRSSEEGGCAMPVQAFHEKPDLGLAKQFLAKENYYWNSGMFFWRVSTFLGELEMATSSLARTRAQWQSASLAWKAWWSSRRKKQVRRAQGAGGRRKESRSRARTVQQ